MAEEEMRGVSGWGSTTTVSSVNTTADELQDKRLWKYGLGVSVPFICVMGIVGNVLSLLVLRNKRKFGAVMFIYVRFMSISDLLAMLICIPESITQGWAVQYDDPATARYFANASVPLVNIFFGSSTLIVMLMTVERFLSVCFPLMARFLSTPSRAHICIGFVYVICIIVYAPMIGEFIVVENTPENQAISGKGGAYTIDWRDGYADSVWYREVYSWVRATLIRFIPFIVIIILNICTIKSYRKIVARRRRMLNRVRQDERRYQEENNLIIILVCTAVIYIVCLSPMPIAHVMLNIKTLKNNYAFQVYLVIGNNLEVLNAALNFYLYCLACREFRNTTRTLLRSCCVQLGVCRRSAYDDDGESTMYRGVANGRTSTVTQAPQNTMTVMLNNSPSTTPPAHAATGSRASLLCLGRDSPDKVDKNQPRTTEAIPLTFINEHKGNIDSGTTSDGQRCQLTAVEPTSDGQPS